MTELTQIDATKIAEGRHIAGVLPYIEGELERLEKALENRVYTLIRNHDMTPDKALAAWYEKHSIHTLRKSLNTKVRIGASVAERNLDALNGETHA